MHIIIILLLNCNACPSKSISFKDVEIHCRESLFRCFSLNIFLDIAFLSSFHFLFEFFTCLSGFLPHTNCNCFASNIIIFFGILSNLYLIFIYKKTQFSDRSAFIFLVIDIFQLGALLYLTGGIANPFVIFLLIPSVFY